ncbi:MAG: hypothetical protein OK474_03320 [Thaumarchaeota archaeon]|nr:hypothetical protein [Nitrososphaerota archaeon]
MNDSTSSSIIIIFIIITLTTTGTFAAVNFAATTTTTATTSNTTSASTTSSSNTTGHTGSEPATPALDGFSQIQYGAKTCLATISTLASNDVLVLFTGGASSGLVFNVTDTANLQWHLRASAQFNSLGTFTETFEEYYATSESPLSGDRISVTNTLSAGSIGCSALGISGADIASPFDPSTGCPSGTVVPLTNQSTPSTINGEMKICTSNPSDILVSSIWIRGDALVSSPAGFTVPPGRLATSPPIGNSPSLNEAYERVLTDQSGLALTWAFGGDSWAMITDAITANGS